MDGTIRRPREIHNEVVDSIDVPVGRRAVRPDDVDRIAESMSRIGLRTPISIKVDVEAETWTLVAGAHRLAAAKKLGWEWIECFHVDGDETDARMVEIAENLHRAELTAVERDEQVEEWTRLVDRVLRQVDAKPGRPESGTRRAARELGLSEAAVRRAKKVASLSDEAKQAARDLGLDDNQSALLDAAQESKPEAQVVRLQTRAAQKHADDPLNDFEARERQVASLMAAWNRASPEARQEFLHRVDRPVMDRAGWSSGTGA